MKFDFRNVLVITVAIIFGLTLVASASAQSAEDLYKAKCAVCHAADGSGNTPAGKKMEVKSFSAPEVAKNSDSAWIEITRTGKGKMPGYAGKLTDDQIKDMVKFIRGLAKGK